VFVILGVGLVQLPKAPPVVEELELIQKLIDVEAPCGLIVPLRTALVWVIEVAADVVAVGAEAAVKLKIEPYVVPAELTAFIWKKYTVPPVKPVAEPVIEEVPEETVPGEAVTETSVQVTIEPSAFDAPSDAIHHVTVVLAPFAVTEPFKVAPLPLIEVAALVVAEGAAAEIVMENVVEA